MDGRSRKGWAVMGLLFGLAFGAEAAQGVPRELGRVDWGRSLTEALVESQGNGRPLFILFQEIPGCATCVGYGDAVLSHPLLQEAIESEFVPLVIQNNRPGTDAAALARFHEPAWNNPVVRYVDAAGRDLIPREDAVWTPWETAGRMVMALQAAHRAVPDYLEIVAEERDEAQLDSVTLGVHCFWEGERHFGALPGVTATEAGFAGGAEAVRITFDPRRLSAQALLEDARSAGLAGRVFARNDAQGDLARRVVGAGAVERGDPLGAAPESDRKYYLRHSPLARLDLTGLQAARVNAALGSGQDPRRWLSPRQKQALGW